MITTMNTKVAILGAGCSCVNGYPLANQMRNHISDFAASVESSAPKLHKLACDTLGVFDELTKQGCPAQTLDDLAWLVNQGKIPVKSGTFKDEHGYRVVEEAKTVVSAMFLAKERNPIVKTLTEYRSFLRRIFPNATRCERALVESPWRVLTFNYDRLFELAFRQHFNVDPTKAFYGELLLNSGLYPLAPEKVEINTERFSLLKLHGSVGFSSVEEYGQCNHYHMTPDLLEPVPISDETFFFGNAQGIYSNRIKPSLIVFPHEKNHLKEYPGNKLPFRAYVPEIWRAASEFISTADEVSIVGYSMPEPDWASMENLLNKTKPLCRIIVQNPDAEKIVAKMRIRFPALADRIAPYAATFGN
jgi:hypothetical protein